MGLEAEGTHGISQIRAVLGGLLIGPGSRSGAISPACSSTSSGSRGNSTCSPT